MGQTDSACCGARPRADHSTKPHVTYPTNLFNDKPSDLSLSTDASHGHGHAQGRKDSHGNGHAPPNHGNGTALQDDTQLPEIIREQQGLLEMKGGGMGSSWQKKFFIVTDNGENLCWYLDAVTAEKRSLDYLGHIPLREIVSVRLVKTRDGRQFEIDGSIAKKGARPAKKLVRFRGADNVAARHWVFLLDTLIKRLQQGGHDLAPDIAAAL
eukprot:GILK01002506.1.p1 GENE.GILK01002506.1~~GILK01002506.1.p1  ORF type:complete len:222 (+),score=24.68 GILK01002506.1:34-666(+)